MKSVLKSACLMLACLLTIKAAAQSPHGFRGPARNGIYNEPGLLKTWPAEGPELLWETMDAGKGYSSPVILEDHLYITGMNQDENKEIFSAYTLDGKKVYEIEYGTPWNKSYPETRTTPTIEGGNAYVISGMGEIVCINIKNGEIVWKIDGIAEFNSKRGTWGTSECPLVFDNKVIYSPAGDRAAMVALDAGTGKTVWQSRPVAGDHSTYVSPLLITHNGKRQIIGATSKNVIGVNPENGNIEWTYTGWERKEENRENIATNTPLFNNGYLFFSNGYNVPAFMLKLNADATGAELAWNNNDLDTHHGGFVLVGNTIYGSNWINNNQGNWVALDWNTGTTKFETAWEGKGKGSIISGGGMLYCYDERRGTIGLVNVNPEKFDLVSEFRITKGEGPHWAHPVIDKGNLYIRHGNALMAYKIK